MDLIKARTKRYKRRQAAFILLAGLCTSRGPFAFCFAPLPAERQMSLEARRQLGTLVLVEVHRYVQRAFGGQRCCFHRWQRGLPHRPRYFSGEKKTRRRPLPAYSQGVRFVCRRKRCRMICRIPCHGKGKQEQQPLPNLPICPVMHHESSGHRSVRSGRPEFVAARNRWINRP
jgi:hypothetical protein